MSGTRAATWRQKLAADFPSFSFTNRGHHRKSFQLQDTSIKRSIEKSPYNLLRFYNK
jgi:hypothetical protein